MCVTKCECNKSFQIFKFIQAEYFVRIPKLRWFFIIHEFNFYINNYWSFFSVLRAVKPYVCLSCTKKNTFFLLLWIKKKPINHMLQISNVQLFENLPIDCYDYKYYIEFFLLIKLFKKKTFTYCTTVQLIFITSWCFLMFFVKQNLKLKIVTLSMKTFNVYISFVIYIYLIVFFSICLEPLWESNNIHHMLH